MRQEILPAAQNGGRKLLALEGGARESGTLSQIPTFPQAATITAIFNDLVLI